jgi:uncharacterized protein (AIM24 family)
VRSDLFTESREVEATSNFTLQNHKMLKCVLGPDVLARQGAMVAYQGDVHFDHQGAGLARYVKQWATGESIPLMRCSGHGEVFFAHRARDVTILYLDNDGVTLGGHNVLAFDASLSWDVKMLHGIAGIGSQGLFNIVVQGTGWVAVTSTGTPLVIEVHPASQTFVDAQSAVAWTTSLRTSVSASVTLGSLIGRGSGELWKMRFEGQHGFVVVQPTEPPLIAPEARGGGLA